MYCTFTVLYILLCGLVLLARYAGFLLDCNAISENLSGLSCDSVVLGVEELFLIDNIELTGNEDHCGYLWWR